MICAKCSPASGVNVSFLFFIIPPPLAPIYKGKHNQLLHKVIAENQFPPKCPQLHEFLVPQLLMLLKCVCFSFSFPFKAWALYQCTFLSRGGSSGRILEILPYDNPLCFGKYCCCKSNRICSNLLLKNRSRCHLCDKPWLQASFMKPRKPAFWMPFGMADSRAATYVQCVDRYVCFSSV